MATESSSGNTPPTKRVLHASKLHDIEEPWKARFDFLKSRGYLLRPRYRPGWEPSWKNPSEALGSEDYVSISRPPILDAKRISDGKVVILKHVPKSSPEQDIGLWLSSPELRGDPKNHGMPLLDVLVDDNDPENVILVLPLLRRIDSPQPESFREVVDFVEQTLEGLEFLHKHKIAHRDCAWGNIMMDARAMFSRGWHPQDMSRFPDGKIMLEDRTLSRSAAGGVRYYFIDFGISTVGEDFTTGTLGQERAPELSATVPYDPYKLDVYILGTAYQHFLLEKFSGLEFLEPLVRSMTAQNPPDRPSSSAAYKQFQSIRNELTDAVLASRIALRPESAITRLYRDSFYRLWDHVWTFTSKWKRPLSPLDA